MLQLEKEFLNNYFSKLKINPVKELQERRFQNVRKKTSFSGTENNNPQRTS